MKKLNVILEYELVIEIWYKIGPRRIVSSSIKSKPEDVTNVESVDGYDICGI